jgi:hypothetical protein
MQTFVLAHELARTRAIDAVKDAPAGVTVQIKPPTRSTDANRAMWAMLTEISNQVVWHGRKLDPQSWKHIFSSSLKRQDVVPNLDGTGFVVLGLSTSSMSKQEMSDLLELIQAFGAEHGVRFGSDAG